MWLPEDTDAALAYIDYEAGLCGGCGLPRHETFDPANFMGYEVEVLQCHACAARDARSAARAKNSDAVSDGIYYAIKDGGAPNV